MNPMPFAFVPRRSCSWIFNDPTGDTGLHSGMFQHGETEAWKIKGEGEKKTGLWGWRGMKYLNCKGLFTLLLLSSLTGWRKKKNPTRHFVDLQSALFQLTWKPSERRVETIEFFSDKDPTMHWLRWSRPISCSSRPTDTRDKEASTSPLEKTHLLSKASLIDRCLAQPNGG